MSNWFDHLGEREHHPTLSQEVEDSISRLEKIFHSKSFFCLLRLKVFLTFLFFVSQVICYLRVRVLNRQVSLPYEVRPHVAAYEDRQKEILENYQYRFEEDLYSVPIDVAMKDLVQLKKSVLLKPDFLHVSQSGLKVVSRK